MLPPNASAPGDVLIRSVSKVASSTLPVPRGPALVLKGKGRKNPRERKMEANLSTKESLRKRGVWLIGCCHLEFSEPPHLDKRVGLEEESGGNFSVLAHPQTLL